MQVGECQQASLPPLLPDNLTIIETNSGISYSIMQPLQTSTCIFWTRPDFTWNDSFTFCVLPYKQFFSRSPQESFSKVGKSMVIKYVCLLLQSPCLMLLHTTRVGIVIPRMMIENYPNIISHWLQVTHTVTDGSAIMPLDVHDHFGCQLAETTISSNIFSPFLVRFHFV